jgi:hypothetical protein
MQFNQHNVGWKYTTTKEVQSRQLLSLATAFMYLKMSETLLKNTTLAYFRGLEYEYKQITYFLYSPMLYYFIVLLPMSKCHHF